MRRLQRLLVTLTVLLGLLALADAHRYRRRSRRRRLATPESQLGPATYSVPPQVLPPPPPPPLPFDLPPPFGSNDGPVGDEEKGGFISIPQDDPDPWARARRLAYRAPFWDFVSYGALDASLANLTMAAPGGILGTTAIREQGVRIAGQLAVSRQVAMAQLLGPMGYACGRASGPSLECLQRLGSYLALYSVLEPQYVPAAAPFWDSDVAFARERLTSSPAFLKAVRRLDELSFGQSDVVGYEQITGGTSMEDLVKQRRLFMVDFFPLYRDGLLEAAPDAFLEVPTAVFFLESPWAAGKSPQRPQANPRLMPLAIQFHVYNQHVYSPLEKSHADWFLAKAIFNALDRDVNAIHHFVLHTAIANIAIAAQKHLAAEHPLYRPIEAAATNGFGIIFTGVSALLEPGGAFDSYLSLSGPCIKAKLFPALMARFDWGRQARLWEDLAARGVQDLPGFLYRDDGAALWAALARFTRSYLEPCYGRPGAVGGDAELQAFLEALSSDPAASPSHVAGFPRPNEVTNLQHVSDLLTQILWVAGVEHHALNSFRIQQFDLVYPHHPGKILSAPLADKGLLSDDDVVRLYISGSGLGAPSGAAATAAVAPTGTAAKATTASASASVSAATATGPNGRVGKPHPSEKIYVAADLSAAVRFSSHGGRDKGAQLQAQTNGNTGIVPPPPPPPPSQPSPAFLYFLETQGFAFAFYPLLQKPARLLNAFFADIEDQRSADAAFALREDLRRLSAAIRSREEATKDAPKYLLLDPRQLPFNLYI